MLAWTKADVANVAVPLCCAAIAVWAVVSWWREQRRHADR